MAKKPTIVSHILKPSEYPIEITQAKGAYTPKVVFAASHPLGLYHVENQGAGYHMAYFTPRRKGSRAKPIGAGNSLAGAMKRISDHEDEMIHKDAPREEGKNGPVSIWALGQRTGAPKPESELDRLMAMYLRDNK